MFCKNIKYAQICNNDVFLFHSFLVLTVYFLHLSPKCCGIKAFKINVSYKLTMHKNYRVLSVILIQHIDQARAIKSCILFKHWVHLKVSRHFSHSFYLSNYQRTFLDGNIFKPTRGWSFIEKIIHRKNVSLVSIES